MVQSGGFEPPAFGATSRRSNQLSYDCTSFAYGLSTNRMHFKLFYEGNNVRPTKSLNKKPGTQCPGFKSVVNCGNKCRSISAD